MTSTNRRLPGRNSWWRGLSPGQRLVLVASPAAAAGAGDLLILAHHGRAPGPVPWWMQVGLVAPSVLLVATACRHTLDAGMTVAAALVGATLAWGLWAVLATPQMISDTANLFVIASFGGRGAREMWRRIGGTP